MKAGSEDRTSITIRNYIEVVKSKLVSLLVFTSFGASVKLSSPYLFLIILAMIVDSSLS